MKILLANPALSKDELKNPVISNLFSNAMPLGICYLGAVLEQKGWDVSLTDGAAERITQEDIVERLKREKFDILGISTTSVSYHRAVELARLAKQKMGKTFPVILGGPHISAVPEQAMEEESFDIGVYGEGEITIVELFTALDQGKDLSDIKGLYYRQDKELIFTGPRPLIQDLDTIPFPARHLLKAKNYFSLPTDVKRLPKFSILANRGCPFNCIFCDSGVVGKKYRTASPKYLVDEMEHLVKNFGAREIFFVGTTFTVSREKTEEFLDELEKRKLNLTWTCSTRVDVVDKALLKRMKDNGCWSIRFGIESGNDDVLKFIRKQITKDQVRSALTASKEVGIHTKAFFIIGHLIDTPQTIIDSIEFAKSLPLVDITVQINTPLPNTDQYKLADQYGTLLKKDYSRYTYFDPVFVPSGMTEKELIYWHRKFYRDFYWRPQQLWRQFVKILNVNTFINYIKCADLIFYLTMKQGPVTDRSQTGLNNGLMFHS